ncbi:hypothetical protein GQ53DRAFT_772915 [Thozetella sp. PMI_491]|nr:hypothetical protein GQ53DRAFT_772915 [Thozetella sp. PMI_491]
MAKGIRRYHHKSRSGCSNCKRRHCNREAPTCSNCFRREECSGAGADKALPSGVSPLAPAAFSRLSLTDPTASLPGKRSCGTNVPVSRQPRSLLFEDAEDAALMRNFIQNTSLEFPFMIAEDQVWRLEIIRTAFHVPYFRYAALAVSGLHICHLKVPSPRPYYYAACRHSAHASSLFRAEVGEITAQNLLPMMAFILCSVVFHLDAAFLTPAMTDGSDPSLPPGLFSGTLGALMGGANHKHRITVDDGVTQALEEVVWFCEDSLAAHPSHPVYSNTLQLLQKWVHDVAQHPFSQLRMVAWPGAVSEEYIELLRDGDEFAAVIFTYWCAIMNRAPERYYMAGNRARLVEIAARGLNQRWDELLKWPRMEVNSGPGVLVLNT